LVDAGEGDDLLFGESGSDWIAGGKGNDTIDAGEGNNLIAFNRGDGADTVSHDASGRDTISLGGGIAYADLSLSKQGSDLLLNTGASERIMFKDWYAATPQHSVANLQVIAEVMAGYNPAGADPLLNKKVERFDFSVIATAFDQALAADPALSAWSLTSKLLDAHLGGSDSEALGGDLAYQYGVNGSLAGIGVGAAQDVLSSAQFAVQPQTLRPFTGLQEGLARLS
jgi:Ca2+-binding RTX toxin-like protein